MDASIPHERVERLAARAHRYRTAGKVMLGFHVAGGTLVIMAILLQNPLQDFVRVAGLILLGCGVLVGMYGFVEYFLLIRKIAALSNLLCSKCGYRIDMSPPDAQRCPECGEDLRNNSAKWKEQVMYPFGRGRLWRAKR